MSDELKPCPFCGGEPKLTTYNGLYYKTDYVVHCEPCDLSLNGDETPEAAVRRWNTRSVTVELPEAQKTL